MQVVKIVVWKEDDAWIGYLQDYPDYWTQGDSLDDLREHLKDLYADLSTGLIPGARRVEDLVITTRYLLAESRRLRAPAPAESRKARQDETSCRSDFSSE